VEKTSSSVKTRSASTNQLSVIKIMTALIGQMRNSVVGFNF